MNQSQLQPVIFGGLFIGVLSSLPIVELGNLCCCLWIVGGGMLTAWLMQRDRSDALTLGEGAWGGFLAGIAGAFVSVAVSVPVDLATAPFQRRMTEFAFDIAFGGDVPPEFREVIESVGSAEGMLAGAVFGFVGMLVAGMIFSTLGGLLGALLFRPSSPAPPYPPAPPSSVPPAPPPPPQAPGA